MLIAQIDRTDAILRYLQFDLTVKTQDEYIKSVSSEYYVKNYSSEYIVKAKQERESAKNKRHTAKWEIEQFEDLYSEEKAKVIAALLIKDVQGILTSGQVAK